MKAAVRGKILGKVFGAIFISFVAMDRNQEVEDPTLGKRASYGCIRLSIEDSKWFYDNISEDTTVFVY